MCPTLILLAGCATMTYSFEEFESQLGFVLQHLYDPSLIPPAQFLQVIGQSPRDGLEVMQTAIIQMVEDLRPPDYVPRSTLSWRYYGILYYRFVSNLSQGEVAEFEQLRRFQPDVIVLDIMLPDVDGWDLLTHLTESPESRNIPVVVSSVMSDKDLAAALGVFATLTKPVQRADFIHALDRASSRT
jgi:CheY-like chemotaxis protein